MLDSKFKVRVNFLSVSASFLLICQGNEAYPNNSVQERAVCEWRDLNPWPPDSHILAGSLPSKVWHLCDRSLSLHWLQLSSGELDSSHWKGCFGHRLADPECGCLITKVMQWLHFQPLSNRTASKEKIFATDGIWTQDSWYEIGKQHPVEWHPLAVVFNFYLRVSHGNGKAVLPFHATHCRECQHLCYAAPIKLHF